VLLVATTNLLSHLDEAVARPGRLGHHLRIEAPTHARDIEVLLRHHLARQAPDLKLVEPALAPLVRALIGCTPARIADIVSAACNAALLARRPPELADLWQAMPQGHASSDNDDAHLAATARHEAAHAVLAHRLGRRLVRMSLVPDGAMIGHTAMASPDRPLTLADLEAEVTILLGGRAMDRLAGPGLCAGAADDLERALSLIGAAYTRWGLHALPLSMPGETLAQRCARDPALAGAIDADMARLQQRADRLVAALAEPIAALAAALLGERHLEADRIRAILEPFHLPNLTEPLP
jgi:ATP-dependent Zn protease